MSGSTRKGRITGTIFGSFFLIPALIFMVAGPLETLRLHLMTGFWDEVPAQLNDIDVKYHSGETTTMSLTGSYSYRYQGRSYSGSQISYDTSADNIGNWHQATSAAISVAAARGELTAWVNPSSPSESILIRDLRWSKIGFGMIFVLVFGGVGVGVIALTWRASAKAEGPVVYSGQQYQHWIFGFMAMMFFLISSPAVFSIPAEIRSGNHAILMVLVFPLVAIALAYAARRSWKNWNYYGKTPLRMNPFPGQLQGDIGGEITIARAGLESSWKVVLQCVRETRSSGKNSTRSESVLWQRSTVPEVTEDAETTRLRFVFQPDASQPASYRKGRTAVFWRIILTGPDTPVALTRHFVLPVVAGERTSDIAVSAEHAGVVAREQADMANASLAQQLGLSRDADGYLIHSAAGRNTGMNLMFLLMGLIFAGAGIFLFSIAAEEGAMLYLMGSVFTLIGTPIFLMGIFALGRSLEARIHGDSITTTRYWMGRPLWRRNIRVHSPDEIRMTDSGSVTTGNTTTEYFHIEVHSGGKKVRIAEQIRERESAEHLTDQLRGLIVTDELL
ncbi:DUF3592 domain-containing protein [Thalassolituus sp.]|uniref:DUF3592 domain-containing protein n=2 Tax=Thalassolituus TaxID=187492 RepID=UPI0035168830|nr:MAG: hypothetical protein CSH36_02960 [Thalassolituus sp.]